MKKLMVGMLLLTGALAAKATDFIGEGGDLAAGGSWEGGTVPTGSAVRLTKNGTYTASADVSFGKMIVTNTATDVTFDLTAGNDGEVRKVSITTLEPVGADRKMTLNGGLWNVSSTFGLCRTSTPSGQSPRATMVLTNGVVVTNTVNVRIAYADSDNLLRLTGPGTRLHAQTLQYDYGRGKRNRLEILDGAKMFLSNQFLDSSGSSQSADVINGNTSLISGQGTSLGTAKLYLGNWAGGSNHLITDGATVSATDFRMGCSAYAPSNVLTVANGASLQLSSHLYLGFSAGSEANVLVVSNRESKVVLPGKEAFVGYAASSSNNRLVLTDGTELSCTCRIGQGAYGHDNTIEVLNGAKLSGSIYVGGYASGTDPSISSTNSTLIVSNATLVSAAPRVGTYRGGYGHRFVLTGPDSSVDFSSYSSANFALFGFSRGCEIVVDDRAPYVFNKALHYAYDSSRLDAAVCSNSVKVLNGASFSTVQSLRVGGGHCANAFDMSLFVGDEASCSCSTLYVSGHDNSVTVSNGTLNAKSSVSIGTIVDVPSGTETRNNRLVLAGSNPSVSVANAFDVSYSSTLRFVLPVEGFVETRPLVSAKTFELSETSDIEIDGAAAFYAAHGERDHRYVFTLVRTTNGITIPDEKLSALRARLLDETDGCGRLRLTADGKELRLEFPSTNGLILHFR